MPLPTSNQTVQSLEFSREAMIEAPIEIVFQAMVDELGPEMQMPNGKGMPMKLEPWPGGRWFRDLGNNSGHLWGHVQVIKPPGLLEICGPMFMSYPGVNHVQYRLVAEGSGTRLKFTHKAMGLIPKEDSEGMEVGWEYGVKRIRELAERKLGAGKKEGAR